MPSQAASLQYLADSAPFSCQARPVTTSPPLRSRAIRSRLTAEGSRAERSVSEYCHHKPSIRGALISLSIALRNFWLMAFTSAAVVVES